MVRSSTSLVVLSTLAGSGQIALAENSQHDIISHFKEQVKTSAHLKSASPLPSTAAKPILHLDLSLYGKNQHAVYEAMLEHESKAAHNEKNKDTKFPHLLCGSQRTAAEARAAIAEHVESRVGVAYASRKADVACWKAPLTAAAADSLAKSNAFFHVTQIPAAAKFAPGLLTVEADKISVAPLALKNGVSVQLESSLSNKKRAKIMKKWRSEGFGAHLSQHMENFFPSSGHGAADRSAWKDIRTTVSKGQCAKSLTVSFSKNTKPSDYMLRLLLDETEEADSFDHCVVAALAYLASHNDVVNVGMVPSVTLHALEPKATTKPTVPHKIGDVTTTPRAVGNVETVSPGISNTISKTALQSGSKNQPNPFWNRGINGTGQFVEVADTGFDDASCFLRQEYSEAYLTGDFNGDVQVERSNGTITDLTRRKIVQYAMRNDTDPTYGYDYYHGHGSHCAGTVAGFIPNDGSTLDSVEDYYYNCNAYIAYCDAWFSATGSDPGTCDTTCGFAPTDDYSGMAPGAQLMVYDFGDANGNLDVPDEMDTYIFDPAYKQGARIFSNSWGSGAPYNYYDWQAINIDQYIYDKDDVVVLVAAGNENTEYDDDVGFEYGDKSIGAPAICKNVITVGAAETAYTPDTLASFSSRGPSRDGRLKPELVGPGDPVYSTAASGEPGLASCTATSKSGTSMATPAVAGATALIRQILTEERHENFSAVGYAGSKYSHIKPSGALMKAILISSTVPMTYGYDSYENMVTLSEFYGAQTAQADSAAYYLGTDGVDYSQGFGHVRLSNVFSLNKSFETFLYEDSVESYSTWTQLYEVASTATDVHVTLVWNDPPGDAYCGYYYETGACVVHDLDLKVYAEGKRHYSNFGAGDGQYSGQEDEINNSEKVTISSSDLNAGTTIMVVVETNGLSYADYQNFSVVVTGNLAEGSPVYAPTPMPTTTTWAPTMTGYCYSGYSMVKVLVADPLHPVAKSLTEVQVGDKILGRNFEGKHVYTPVRALPHGPSTQAFVGIHMNGAGAEQQHRVMATTHHTFPTCNGKVKEAHDLAIGDCLFTEQGKREINNIHTVAPDKLAEQDALTYTVEVDDDIEAISIGGVFTHARSGQLQGASVHIQQEAAKKHTTFTHPKNLNIKKKSS